MPAHDDYLDPDRPTIVIPQPTPTPWRVDTITDAAGADFATVIMAGDKTLAIMSGSAEQAHADAELMAAAPALRDALVELYEAAVEAWPDRRCVETARGVLMSLGIEP